jgi:ubiquinol-cytochrome c reductase iron-sulfur subunit
VWRRKSKRKDEQPSSFERSPLAVDELSSSVMAEAYRAALDRPSDPEHTEVAPRELQDEPPDSQRMARAERRTERLVSVLFVASLLGSLLFGAAYIWMPIHGSDLGRNQNLVLGSGLGLMLLALGVGLAIVGKKLAPALIATQERPPHHSEPEDELAAEHEFLGGFRELGFHQRRILRRTLLMAVGFLPLPFVVALRDTGPRPGPQLEKNAWSPGARLVDPDTGYAYRLGDLEVGEAVVAMPEGKTDTSAPVNAESAVMLIRLPPGLNRPRPGRAGWAAADHVCYSRICTHAGCPVGQYERQKHELVCPCHWSQFDVPDGCAVKFGPAPRALPQLPIYVDGEGFFRAQSRFHESVGPTYWEQGG